MQPRRAEDRSGAAALSACGSFSMQRAEAFREGWLWPDWEVGAEAPTESLPATVPTEVTSGLSPGGLPDCLDPYCPWTFNNLTRFHPSLTYKSFHSAPCNVSLSLAKAPPSSKLFSEHPALPVPTTASHSPEHRAPPRPLKGGGSQPVLDTAGPKGQRGSLLLSVVSQQLLLPACFTIIPLLLKKDIGWHPSHTTPQACTVLQVTSAYSPKVLAHPSLLFPWWRLTLWPVSIRGHSVFTWLFQPTPRGFSSSRTSFLPTTLFFIPPQKPTSTELIRTQTPPPAPSQSARVSNTTQNGWLGQRSALRVWEAGESRVKAPTDMCLPRAPSPVRRRPSSHGVLTRPRWVIFPGSLLRRALVPFTRALLSCPDHLPKVPPNTTTWGLGLQPMNSEGTQTFTPSRKHPTL